MARDLEQQLQQAGVGVEVGDVADPLPRRDQQLEQVAGGQLGRDGVALDGDEVGPPVDGGRGLGRGLGLGCGLGWAGRAAEQLVGLQDPAGLGAVAAVEVGVGPPQGAAEGGAELVCPAADVDAQEATGLVGRHGADGTVAPVSSRRWIVIGAGAIGGTVGGRLHQGGAEVVLVARGAHGEALRRDGLLLRDPDAEARLPIPAVAHPAEVDWRPGDVALVATKTQDVAAALDDLAAAVPDVRDVPVVCLTNGLEAERQALRRFPAVHGMCVMLPATHLEPGVVEVWSAPCGGVLDVGLAVGGCDEVDEALAAALRAGSFVADPTPAVMRRKRCKLLLNLANVVDASCGTDPDAGPIVAAAMEEGRRALTAAGLDFSTPEEDAARRGDHIRMRRIDGRKREGGSTWQSLARGLPSTEADHLNGEVVLLGRLHGVETPVNEGLQRLARHLAATRAAPGSMSAADVEAWIA